MANPILVLAEQLRGEISDITFEMLGAGRKLADASGAPLYAAETGGEPVGTVTSGGFGPSVAGPVAMGYVPTALSAAGTRLFAEVRGKRLPLAVAALPFITQRYKRS